MKSTSSSDLGSYLDEVVYPSLFDRLDVAFPEFGWRRAGDHWTATTWPPTLPYSVNHQRPDRLMVYPDRPWWLKVHGHSGVRWLDLVNGGRRPVGADFPAGARALCERAGVPFPERSLSPEEQERARRREGRRALLHTVIAYLQERLWSSAGEAARAFLHGRGFTDDEIRDLGFGLYRSAAEVRRAIVDEGHPLGVIDESGVGWSRLKGYIILPWHDAHGHPLTLYGRWVGEPPSGTPKTIALPGEGTKASPLFFDRARRAGHKDLVVVEGLFDAALAQVRGDTRVVAGVAAQLSGAQVETLCRYQIASVTICLDPDGGGERGTLACVDSLDRAGIVPYVAPRLSDGLDPDDLIQRDGIDAWRRHLEGAVHGYRYRAQRIVSTHRGPQGWTDGEQERAIAEAVTFAASRPVGRTDPLARYFWPALADAMPGLDVAAVQARGRARTRSPGPPRRGRPTGRIPRRTRGTALSRPRSSSTSAILSRTSSSPTCWRGGAFRSCFPPGAWARRTWPTPGW